MQSGGGGRNEAVQELCPKHALHLQPVQRARQRTFPCHPLPAVHSRLHRTAAVVLRPLLPGRAPDQMNVVNVPIALPIGRHLPVPAHRAHLWRGQMASARCGRPRPTLRTGAFSTSGLSNRVKARTPRRWCCWSRAAQSRRLGLDVALDVIPRIATPVTWILNQHTPSRP